MKISKETFSAAEGKSAYELTLDHEERLLRLEDAVIELAERNYRRHLQVSREVYSRMSGLERQVEGLQRALREYIEEAPHGLSSARAKARYYLGPEV